MGYKDFAEAIRQLVKDNGKDALLIDDNKQLGKLLGDYGKRQFGVEANAFLQMLDAGCAHDINETDDVLSCKRGLVERMDEEYGISRKISVPMLDLLGLLLRDDTTMCGGQPAKEVSLPNTTVNTTAETKTNVNVAPSFTAMKTNVNVSSSFTETKTRVNEFSSFTDPRDGQVYKTVKIGNQVWMAENLRYNIKGSWCFDNYESNNQKYGRFYNWDAAKKVCPKGWHLPTRAEWDELVAYVGGEDVAGKKLKSTIGWKNGGNGTDEYGFSALPGGSGNFMGHHFDTGDRGTWWTATKYDGKTVWMRMMRCDDDYVRDYHTAKEGCKNVRCVRD